MHAAGQIVRRTQDTDRILAEGVDVLAVFWEPNVTEASYYGERNQFGGLKAEDARKLEYREKQNPQLKRSSQKQSSKNLS